MQKPPYETLKALSDPKLYDFEFDSSLTVQNLTFTEINGVSWDKFSNSVFRIGKSSIITGNLKISQLSVENLKANAIDGVNVSDFFTKTTDQVVACTIHFHNIYVDTHFNCSQINDLDIRDVISVIPGDVIVVKGKFLFS